MIHTADVCIVGAGIAGIVLAHSIVSKSNLRVVVVESGGPHEDAGVSAALNHVEHARRVHAGSLEGRARCLGGTSTLWGGALLSLQREDFEGVGVDREGAWPLGLDDLQPYYTRALKLFGVERPDFGIGSLPAGLRRSQTTDVPDFEPRYAMWPPFARRNLWALLGDSLQRGGRVSFLPQTHFTRWELDDAGRVRAIACTGAEQRELRIVATHFVLASGCIESVRQLLLLDRASDGRAVDTRAGLGAYFQEHLSTEAYALRPSEGRRFNEFFGHSFHAALMRTLRFERKRRIGEPFGASFFHVTYSFPEDSGFELAKSYLRGLQRTRSLKPSAAQLRGMLGCAGELAHMAWWRYARGQLWFSPRAQFRLTVDIEQEISPSNRIVLSDNVDRYGVPLARMKWDVSENDAECFIDTCRRIRKAWSHSMLSKVADLEGPAPSVAGDEELKRNFLEHARDTYHPSGGARMGRDARASVVSADLCVRGVPNVHVASTAVFPSSGSANPTLTLMALAIRLGDRLATQSA